MRCEVQMEAEHKDSDVTLSVAWTKEYEFPFYPREGDRLTCDGDGPYRVTSSEYDFEKQLAKVKLRSFGLDPDNVAGHLQTLCVCNKAEGWKVHYVAVDRSHPAAAIAIVAGTADDAILDAWESRPKEQV